MKKGAVVGLSLFCAGAIVAGSVIFVTIRTYVKAFQWDIHQNVSSDAKERLSSIALMPEASGCIEYYSVMGARDPSYLITSYSYGSVDSLCNSLPEGCRDGIEEAVNSGEYKQTEDVLNNMVKRYDVSADDLPLISEDEVDKRYSAAARGAFRYYYVLEYEDGTYRFEMRVDEV